MNKRMEKKKTTMKHRACAIVQVSYDKVTVSILNCKI